MSASSIISNSCALFAHFSRWFCSWLYVVHGEYLEKLRRNRVLAYRALDRRDIYSSKHA